MWKLRGGAFSPCQRLAVWCLGVGLLLACRPAETPPASAPAAAADLGAASPSSPTAAAGQPAGSAPSTIKTVKLAVPGRGVASLPLVVAQKEGILARYGLGADIQPLRQDAAMAALASGDVDYLTSTFGGAAGNSSGLPEIVVMVMTGRPQHTIMSRVPMGSVQDLRGKALVVDVPGGILDFMARQALLQADVPPDDVSFLYAGTPEARLGLLLANQVDAGTMDLVSTIKAREQGYSEVVDLGKVISLPLNGLVTTPQRIKEQPDEIRSLARAILEGTTFLRANRAATIQTIAEWSDVDEALAAALYDLARDSYTLDGRVSDEVMKTTIEAQIGYQPGSPIDLERFVDWSLLPSS
jgi:ABC-type nitrate/sulfonate/bicarbonate transport system substrate-binding protein